jgi:hypothetical protein
VACFISGSPYQALKRLMVSFARIEGAVDQRVLLAHVVAAALGVLLVLVFGGDGDKPLSPQGKPFQALTVAVWPSVRLREVGAVQVPPAGGTSFSRKSYSVLRAP